MTRGGVGVGLGGESGHGYEREKSDARHGGSGAFKTCSFRCMLPVTDCSKAVHKLFKNTD